MIEKLVIKYGTGTLIVFVVIALLPIFLFQTEYSEGYSLSFKWLTVPVIAIVFAVYWYLLPNLRKQANMFTGIAMCALIIFNTVFAAGSILELVNLLGPQRPVDISGTIVEKTEKRSWGKNASLLHYVVIDESSTGSTKKIPVSKQKYNDLSAGDSYDDVWRVGLIGLMYKKANLESAEN